MSLTAAMNSALNGVRTSQKAIDVVSQNVSNIHTEGYSRKVYSQQSIVLNNGIYSGSKANTDLRQVDNLLRQQLRTETGTLQSVSVRAYYLGLIQQQMGTPSAAQSVSNRIAAVQTAFESLGVDADKLNSQSSAVTSLDTALTQMQSLSKQIQEMRLEIDNDISSLCDEASDILMQLDKLNDDIVRTTAIGGTSADNYKDQRDTMITRLSEIMDIHYYERSTGETVILTGGGKPLLDKNATLVTHTPASSTGALIGYSSGTITGIYAGSFDITKEISSGELHGLITLRDTELQDLQTQMDELAYQLTQQMNKVHNEGVNFPNTSYEMTGTRTFIDGGQQQSITFGDGDVKIVLFNSDGTQAYSTSLVAELDFTGGTISELADTIQDWLRNSVNGPKLETATVKVDENGKFSLDLGSSKYSIAFRDETSVLHGSSSSPISIGFDADANGTIDRTYSGLSSFLGLNDLIVSTSEDAVYESEIISGGSLMGIKGTTILNFSDTINGLNFGEIEVKATDSVIDIAEKINTTMVDASGKQLVRAEVIKEGSGYRLRITNNENVQMEITETRSTVNGVTSGSVIERLGLGLSHAGYSSNLNVRADIVNSPALMNTGKVQYSTQSGEYFVSDTDNSLANDFADLFNQTIEFGSAGSFTKTTTTLSKYASSIVSGLANRLNDASSKEAYQTDLVTSIYSKEQDVSGVDLDEELAMMLVYERSYSAAARVLSTAIELLEILDQMV